MSEIKEVKVMGELGEGSLLPAIELMALGLGEEALRELDAYRRTDAKGMLALRHGLSDGARFDRGGEPNTPADLQADPHYGLGLRASAMLMTKEVAA